MTTYRICCCFWRRYKPASDEPPEAVKVVFTKYADQNGTMGAEQLRRFMAEVQGEAVETAEAAARDVLDSFRHFMRKGLSLDTFFKYLTSNENSALDSSVVHQDMGAPLSHYFIYTSHNSYLTGNQLNSDSSDVPIVKALQRGVRVIELDMWPNDKKDDISILHGRTLTTPVGLMKCLKSIRDHAFAASPYPVIITLEDHLPPDLQAKAAKMIHETFGEMLFLPNSDSLREFPSPEELKMKIIISTKPPKEFRETESMKEREDEAQKDAEEGAWGEDVPDLDVELSAMSKIEEREASERFHEEEEEEEDTEGVEQRPTQRIVAPEYKSLIAITAKKKTGGLSDALKIDPHKVTRLSLREQVFIKATASHGTEIVRFTQKNLLRIYPRGTRFTSSNYNPVPGWIHGAQLVALNMQGRGRALWLMQGMFRANGGCGYVKKPDLLLDSDRIFDPKSTPPIKKTLKVRVYMGDGWRFDFGQAHFDQYSPPDFYTRVGIAGVPADTTMKRTRAVEDNWTPMWDEEFAFPLRVPELALLRIEVHEYDMSDKDDFGGQTCLPVWELRSGIRSVRLCDQKGDLLPSVKLLMHFEFV